MTQIATSLRRTVASAAVYPVRENEGYSMWCADVALCSCPGVAELHGVDLIPAARGSYVRNEMWPSGKIAPHGFLYDRCLLCGRVWTARDYRWQFAAFIKDPGFSTGMPRGDVGDMTSKIAPLVAAGWSKAEMLALFVEGSDERRNLNSKYLQLIKCGSRRKAA